MKMRNTIQRALVLETVKKLRCHATADEVYDTVVKKYSDISKGTVYRNLNLLSDIGAIRKVEIKSGPVRFDHICKEHYHVICIKCDRLFDVQMEFITDLEKNIKDTHGFVFTGHDVIFKGICPECNP